MRNNKRVMTGVSLALCGMLWVTSVIPVRAVGENKTYEEYRSGQTGEEPDTGEEEYTVISISNEEELAELARNCGLDSWSVGKYVKLEGNIILSKHCDLMIPSFGGIFDGGGYTISGLDIRAAGSATGLFRYIRQGAVVRNLTVTGRVSPEGSKSETGILAGVNYGSIMNCSVSGSVSGEESVGGLAGVNEASGEIRQCSARAMVVGDHYVGGICGRNYGTLNNCSNSGNINTYSKEVTYDLDEITMENLENLNSMENVAAHTDTGGIAGYSEGKIYYCSNTGTVGYQHVGYNTGGIVGRLHQGYLQNCTNSGEILGRKDVGGIVGQMEPFLEVQYLDDKLKEIDRETEKLLDLLDGAQQNLNDYGKQVSDLTGKLTTSLKNASAAAGNLSGAVNELWYIYNQELTGVGNDLKRLNTDLENQGNTDRENGNTTDHTISGGDLGDGSDITITVPNDTESYRAALRRFADSTGTHITNMTTASTDRSGGITENLNTLNREMEAAGNYLEQLADVLSRGTNQTGEDMDAVAAQARVLRKSISELRDDLFRYEGISVSDASDEAAAEGEDSEEPGNPKAQQEEAYYDTSTFQQGKISLCVNEGKVEADTNVGGIVGQIATEVDFDPEEDITLIGEESFDIEQTVKAVVRESLNYGDVTGKKDYVGGIVGKADFGAVISCEAYGRVSSTGGSYVGGIVGASGYTVRSCSFLGGVSGKNYVGGIVGKGCDIFYSIACPRLEMTGEYGGSIAGQLEKEGMISGNYYAEGNLPGVDFIGYDGGATPMEYRELCSMAGVPEAFRSFDIVFMADGKELASFTCQYGDALEENMIPAIPQKEGCYSNWPEFDYSFITGSCVLEAEYHPWISSIAGEEKDENGRALILARGNFRPGASLRLTEEGEGKRLEILYQDEEGSVTEEYTEPVRVRILSEDPEHTVVECYDGSKWDQTECETIGSYLEFSMEKPGIFRVTILQDRGKIKMVMFASLGCGLLLVFLFISKLIKHFRKKRGNEKVKERDGGREETAVSEK
ncbi:MAG: GLUG motif-containing protein [Acetatifactor sp.]